MNSPEPDDAALRRYLLGFMPEAEAGGLEEAYFARPDVLERLRGAEDDLLDDYAADRLESGEKEAFENRYFAAQPLRERAAAARALRLAAAAKGGPAARPRAGRWGIPMTIAAGLLVAVLAFWVRPSRGTRVAAIPAPSTAAPSELPLTPSAAPSGSSVPVLPTAAARPVARPLVLALSPVLLRGADRPAELHVPPEAETVVLELEGDSAFVPLSAPLEAVVKTVEGELVWRGNARRLADARRPSLLATAGVPAERLGRGDYVLTLSVHGAADATIARYFFRVAR